MKLTKRLICLMLALILAAGMCITVSAEEEADTQEKNGDVYILYTSDIHCGIEKGFGLAGLQAVRDSLESQGYTTILVDDGDAVQGEALGTLTRGEAMIRLLNTARYDVAIPGNHEFDYGVGQLMKFAETAEYPYLSCNFNKEGELLFQPYTVIEAAGMKIAFVGVTTPYTLRDVSRKVFRDEAGNYIYDFMQDDTGEKLYAAVQEAVDSARAEGADFVYLMGHLGNEEICHPYTYADVIANTSGIDVMLDGHSHDKDQVVMKNKDGREVTRTACGTKLEGIGYSHITKDGEIAETGIWKWDNEVPAFRLLGIHNEVSEAVAALDAELEEILQEVVAWSDADLTIYDPEAKDSAGKPVRMVRRAETNLGDLCADAILEQSGADIAVMNGGGVRTSIGRGEVTYGDIISVLPFNNDICVIEAIGQQILDLLEYGCRGLPEESGGFQQVAGIRFDIDVSVPTGVVTDANGGFSGVEGEYRIKNVMVGDEPLDPERTYSLAGTSYTLQNNSGFNGFEGARILNPNLNLDCLCLIDYIQHTLDGVIGGKYMDPYGDGRIRVIGAEE